MPRIGRILVPVDFSESSRAALEYGIFVARPFSAPVEVLHVWEPPIYGPDGLTVHQPGEPPMTLEDYVRQRVSDEIGQLISSVTEGAPAGAPRIEGRMVVGNPVDGIVGVARTDGIDLIVMGTHGRRGFSRVVMGSVAERVLRSAPCPVLTVRATAQQPTG